jgi:ribonuclease G
MSKELIVSAGRHETRVAILEDDQVVELFHEREKEYSLAGSIHKGRVTRVLPGMQSAFVDIGLDRDAFLYVSDFFEDNDEYDAVVSTVEEKVLKMERGPSPSLEADRVDRQEPVRSIPPPLPTEDFSTGETTAVLGGAGAPPATGAEPEARPEGARDGRGDRGGRGRRGRRRRGGRGSTLPDSKFFSPKADGEGSEPEADTDREAPEAASQAAVEPAPYFPFSRPQNSDDLMVLPGESLAKYTSGDNTSGDSTPEPVNETAEAASPVSAETPSEMNVEAALPGEHPLAGFGEIASWATTAAEEPAVTEPAPAEDAKAENSEVPPPLPQTPAAFEEPAIAPEPVEIAEPVAAIGTEVAAPETIEEEETGISASEVAEGEFAHDIRAAEFFDADAPSFAASGTDEAAAEGTETNVEEGPEPARIPTSLTAALREQGHRYPHRVSRRMRRKMRGGQPVEEGERQPAEATAAPKADGGPEGGGDGRNVSPRREERPSTESREQQPREGREPREAREPREGREPREAREPKENREQREPREPREPREARGQDRGGRERPERERPPLPSISDLLKEGQEIIVQIAKEPLGQKGARITSHIALPGRFVVYMPTVEHVGVSRKIPSDDERQRLKRILQTHRQGVPGGFICRTAAENKSEEELKSDMHFLYNLWLDMRQKAEKKPAPVLLHHDLDLVQRILRDQLTTSFKTIWVDNEELFESILSFVQRFQPALVGRVKLYTRSNPIFDEFGITAEVEKALRPKVWLKSGGYIVINQTEALVAIDINTGKYVGKSNRLEDTIVKINTDAIKEIVRQIRLRDLGGIIVVDFIDMDERKNRQKVMLALEDCMRADRAPYKILQFNDFGLVAITRKRVKQSLERTLCSPCGYCEGAGYIKSVGTVVSEILIEAQKMRKALEAEQSNIVLRVNPEVARVLKSNNNSYLQELEEIIGKSVLVKSDPQLHQTKFDLA